MRVCILIFLIFSNSVEAQIDSFRQKQISDLINKHQLDQYSIRMDCDQVSLSSIQLEYIHRIFTFIHDSTNSDNGDYRFYIYLSGYCYCDSQSKFHILKQIELIISELDSIYNPLNGLEVEIHINQILDKKGLRICEDKNEFLFYFSERGMPIGRMKGFFKREK